LARGPWAGTCPETLVCRSGPAVVWGCRVAGRPQLRTGRRGGGAACRVACRVAGHGGGAARRVAGRRCGMPGGGAACRAACRVAGHGACWAAGWGGGMGRHEAAGWSGAFTCSTSDLKSHICTYAFACTCAFAWIGVACERPRARVGACHAGLGGGSHRAHLGADGLGLRMGGPDGAIWVGGGREEGRAPRKVSGAVGVRWGRWTRHAVGEEPPVYTTYAARLEVAAPKQG
jgi:hypothetical protein